MSQRSKKRQHVSQVNKNNDNNDDNDDGYNLSQYSQRGRRGNQASQSSDVHDFDLSQSQGTQWSQRKSLPVEEETQLVGSVIRYLLAVDRTKLAIQRVHLIKNVFGNHGRHYRQIMAKVQSTLREVFGYTLFEFESNKYIIINDIPNDTPHLYFSQRERTHQVLLFFVLSHIFMSNDSITEESLWHFLRQLDIIKENSFRNDYYGDVHQLITKDFVKQHYLDMIKVGNSDPPKYEFQWGIRAKNELSKRHVLQFVSKVYKDRPMNSWSSQFRAMEESENANRSR